MTWHRTLRRRLPGIRLVLASGYVLWFFSEKLFWGLWRPDDDIGVEILTWWLYALFGYVMLAALRIFAVHNLRGLLVAGAIFGWLSEGVFAMSLFGGELPFPITIVWTGIAWHALISVLVGWYGLRRALQSASPLPTAAGSLALGLFWGLWAASWAGETPPVVASVPAFFANAMLATLGLMLAMRMIDGADTPAFRPSRLGLSLTLGPLAAFFAIVTVPAAPVSLIVLVPLFGTAVMALHRQHKARAVTATDLLSVVTAPSRHRNILLLALMPIVATAVHATLSAVRLVPPSHQIVFAVTFLAGLTLYPAALVSLWRSPGRLRPILTSRR